MAKKRVSVYMKEDDLIWLATCPIAGSMSGSAVFIMEWAMVQVKRGLVIALEKFSYEELHVIIDFANQMKVTPDYTPAVFASAIEDWLQYNKNGQRKCDEDIAYKINTICKSLTAPEVIGLLSWAAVGKVAERE